MNRQNVSFLFLASLLSLSPLAHGAAWQTALVEQTDPAKLATLGTRGANPRVNRVVFYLHQAQTNGTAPAEALDWAFAQNGTTGLVAVLSKETQLLNFEHAVDWGLLTEDNLEKLKRGDATTITKGWYKDNPVDVDHIVPVSLAPEAGNSLANLELQPASANRSKGARIGLHEVKFASRLFEAGLLSDRTLGRVRRAFILRAVVPWLALAAVLVGYWRIGRSGRSILRDGLRSVLSGMLRRLFRRHGF